MWNTNKMIHETTHKKKTTAKHKRKWKLIRNCSNDEHFVSPLSPGRSFLRWRQKFLARNMIWSVSLRHLSFHHFEFVFGPKRVDVFLFLCFRFHLTRQFVESVRSWRSIHTPFLCRHNDKISTIRTKKLLGTRQQSLWQRLWSIRCSSPPFDVLFIFAFHRIYLRIVKCSATWIIVIIGISTKKAHFRCACACKRSNLIYADKTRIDNFVGHFHPCHNSQFENSSSSSLSSQFRANESHASVAKEYDIFVSKPSPTKSDVFSNGKSAVKCKINRTGEKQKNRKKEKQNAKEYERDKTLIFYWISSSLCANTSTICWHSARAFIRSLTRLSVLASSSFGFFMFNLFNIVSFVFWIWIVCSWRHFDRNNRRRQSQSYTQIVLMNFVWKLRRLRDEHKTRTDWRSFSRAKNKIGKKCELVLMFGQSFCVPSMNRSSPDLFIEKSI